MADDVRREGRVSLLAWGAARGAPRGRAARERSGAELRTSPVLLTARLLSQGTYNAYGQVLFGATGPSCALLVAASFTAPRVGGCGLAAALTANVAARLLSLSPEAIGTGHYAFNALLCGLGIGAWFELNSASVGLLAAVAVTSVFVQLPVEAALARLVELPGLSVPFVAVSWGALQVAGVLAGMEPARAEELSWLAPLNGSRTLASAWMAGFDAARALGAVLFVPSPIAGLLVLSALLIHSRIATLLSLVGLGVAAAAQGAMTPGALGAVPGAVALGAGFNAALTAIGLGGVWFIPRPSSFLLAGLSATFASVLSVIAATGMADAGLPVLTLPFNVTCLWLLYALRQRPKGDAPRFVDGLPGTPEENLQRHRARLFRAGTTARVLLRLPVLGRWTVTQGFDGPHTHRGSWRHAVDLEALDRDRRAHEGNGEALTAYHSYRLPVLAAAAGTVVRARGDVPDNPPGQTSRDASANWGNYVVLQHAPGIFSMVAHLTPGSLEVVEGQQVAAGARLGLSGNSGRSLVPHVHFHVQAGPEAGAPTIAFSFSELVVDAAGPGEGPRAAPLADP